MLPITTSHVIGRNSLIQMMIDKCRTYSDSWLFCSAVLGVIALSEQREKLLILQLDITETNIMLFSEKSFQVELSSLRQNSSPKRNARCAFKQFRWQMH